MTGSGSCSPACRVLALLCSAHRQPYYIINACPHTHLPSSCSTATVGNGAHIYLCSRVMSNTASTATSPPTTYGLCLSDCYRVLPDGALAAVEAHQMSCVQHINSSTSTAAHQLSPMPLPLPTLVGDSTLHATSLAVDQWVMSPSCILCPLHSSLQPTLTLLHSSPPTSCPVP